MKVRIIPGDFGAYTSKGGSWDDSNPVAGSFEVDLHVAPIKGSAVLYPTPDGERLGQIQEVVVSKTFVYVFVPVSREV